MFASTAETPFLLKTRLSTKPSSGQFRNKHLRSRRCGGGRVCGSGGDLSGCGCSGCSIRLKRVAHQQQQDQPTHHRPETLRITPCEPAAPLPATASGTVRSSRLPASSVEQEEEEEEVSAALAFTAAPPPHYSTPSVPPGKREASSSSSEGRIFSPSSSRDYTFSEGFPSVNKPQLLLAPGTISIRGRGAGLPSPDTNTLSATGPATTVIESSEQPISPSSSASRAESTTTNRLVASPSPPTLSPALCRGQAETRMTRKTSLSSGPSPERSWPSSKTESCRRGSRQRRERREGRGILR